MYAPVLFVALSAVIPVLLLLVWAGLQRLYGAALPSNNTLPDAHGYATSHTFPGGYAGKDWPPAHVGAFCSGNHWHGNGHSRGGSEEDLDDSDLVGQVWPHPGGGSHQGLGFIMITSNFEVQRLGLMRLTVFQMKEQGWNSFEG